MNTFTVETKQNIVEAQNGFCKSCLNLIHSIHHKLPNTKANQNRFPRFINSPMNGVGLCMHCHDNMPHVHRITEKEAEVYEKYLSDSRVLVSMEMAGV